MKKYILYINILFLISLKSDLNSQSQIGTYFGINISNVKFHSVNKLNQIDSSAYQRDWIALPSMGIAINYSIAPKLKITTSLGVNFIGSKNYTPGLNGPHYIDKNLRLTFIELKGVGGFEIIENVILNIGYSLNYGIRKNQEFFVRVENNEIVNIYNEFQHTICIGTTIELIPFNLGITYNHGLSTLYNTRNHLPNEQTYLKLCSMQLIVTYFIK